MAHGRCGADGCETVGRLARGWCQACYAWSRNHGWQDPGGRPKRQKAPADGQCTVVEGGVKCSRLYWAEGMCTRHRARAKRYGDPLTLQQRSAEAMRQLLQDAARAETDECIIAAARPGQLITRYRGTYMAAARAVWIIRHGDPGEGHVLHTCNGGSGANGCINVRHLRLGDNSRNVLDRGDAGVQVGEGHHSSVLTEDGVRAIRERASAGETHAALAKEYGVCRATVGDVVARRTWRRLQ